MSKPQLEPQLDYPERIGLYKGKIINDVFVIGNVNAPNGSFDIKASTGFHVVDKTGIMTVKFANGDDLHFHVSDYTIPEMFKDYYVERNKESENEPLKSFAIRYFGISDDESYTHVAVKFENFECATVSHKIVTKVDATGAHEAMDYYVKISYVDSPSDSFRVVHLKSAKTICENITKAFQRYIDVV